jgi:hypothetical protein
MENQHRIILALLSIFSPFALAAAQTLASPDGRLAVTFETDAQGMRWSLVRDGKTLIRPSALGYEFAETSPCDKDGRHLAPMKAIAIATRTVRKGDLISFAPCPEGGAVAVFTPVTGN